MMHFSEDEEAARLRGAGRAMAGQPPGTTSRHKPPAPGPSMSDDREYGKVREDWTCTGGVRVVVSRCSLSERWHGCGCGGRRVGSGWTCSTRGRDEEGGPGA